MVAEAGRSARGLAAEVAALHAQVCRMEVLMAWWYARDGLPIPDGLPALSGSPGSDPAAPGPPRAAKRRRIEAMGLRAV